MWDEWRIGDWLGNNISSGLSDIGGFFNNAWKSVFPGSRDAIVYNNALQGFSNSQQSKGWQNDGFKSDPPWGSITQKESTWVDAWAESTNIFAQATYGIANSFSVVGQSLNPFDNQVTALTGEGVHGDRSYYGGDVASSLLPIGAGFKYGAQGLKVVGKSLINKLLFGGKTFTQFKKVFWANKTKPILDPIIDPNSGQVWKQYMELHHRFISQRWNWAPNWLKNN